ncbi:MAG: hypothetical protein AB8B83_09665 [Bdellovibrionales bacterium]
MGGNDWEAKLAQFQQEGDEQTQPPGPQSIPDILRDLLPNDQGPMQSTPDGQDGICLPEDPICIPEDPPPEIIPEKPPFIGS